MTDKTSDESALAPTASPPAPEQFLLYSAARSRHNRTARAALPQSPRRKQYIGRDQIRLAHGRPIVLSKQQLLENLDEIKEKVAAHAIEVKTSDGRMVDLETLQPTTQAEPVGETRPNFPLDSVANDKNFPGLNITPPYQGDDVTTPQVLEPGQKPALFEHAEQVAEEAGEAAPEMPEDVSSDKTRSSGKKKHR